jgi:hypothetical protein
MTVRHTVTGTPQGGVISPLLCNVYLNRLDREWETEPFGTLVRYADDLVVMCSTGPRPSEPGPASRPSSLTWGSSPRRRRPGLCTWRREARVSISSASTTAWCAPVDGVGRSASSSSPAGPHVGRLSTHETASVRSRRDLACWFAPRWSCRISTRFLRGWAGYFRIGNSALAFDKVSRYAVGRLAIFVAKLHRRSTRYGWAVFRSSPNRMGLVSLSGLVVAPRPNLVWRSLVTEHRR